MTYVVAEPCVNCRYTDCAIPCPVEAFHLDDDMLVINPDTCIDCDACVPECPVEEPCVNCRYTDCAIPCPVEAFHLDDDMLVINPDTCIDCDACVPECPVEAVF